jgi:phosphoglycerate dehydrogenase-like enzyme
MTSSTLTTSVLVASEPESARPLPEPAGTPETTPRVVGVVGLGHMGTAFALNLIADGCRVLVYDRNPARLEALRGSRAQAGS